MSNNERSQFIIKLARALLAAGKARGWSDAIEQARKLVEE